MSIVEKVLVTLAVLIGFPFALMVLWILISIPRMAYVEAVCLEAGYPKHSITWHWHGYCYGLEGDVRTPVHKLKDLGE